MYVHMAETLFVYLKSGEYVVSKVATMPIFICSYLDP